MYYQENKMFKYNAVYCNIVYNRPKMTILKFLEVRKHLKLKSKQNKTMFPLSRLSSVHLRTIQDPPLLYYASYNVLLKYTIQALKVLSEENI